MLICDRARHPGSDAEVELLAGSVWTVHAGKVTRVELYANREELFEASGFSPPGPRLWDPPHAPTDAEES